MRHRRGKTVPIVIGGGGEFIDACAEVQRMLDENARLIEVVGAKQNEGKARPASPLRPHPHSRPRAACTY